MLLVMTALMLFGADVAEGLGIRSKPGDDVTIYPAFGPESPGPYKHPATITELANGDLYIAYYGGSGEYITDTAVYGSRKKKGEKTWSTPKVIADTPFFSDGNGVVWQAPDGLVWLFYVVRYGETWSNSRIQGKISRDNAETWSDPFILTFEEGTMVRGRPIVNEKGDYLLPVYHETGHDIEFLGPDSSSFFLYYDQKTKKWTETNRIHSRIGNIQPAVDVVDGDYLVTYCRRGGGYDPRKDGFIVRSESRDGGRKWSEGTETKFPNPNAAVDFIRLQSGSLLLVYNNSFEDRTPLTIALSTDKDKTYSYRRDIADAPHSLAYPFVIQGKDGTIHIVFTCNERTVINHATFREDAIHQDKYLVK